MHWSSKVILLWLWLLPGVQLWAQDSFDHDVWKKVVKGVDYAPVEMEDTEVQNITPVSTPTINTQTIWIALLAIAMIVVVLWVLQKVGWVQLFPSQRQGIQVTEVEKDVPGADFEAAIKQALEQKRYDLAIRFQYLKTLQQLHHNGFITWQRDLTNRHYVIAVRKQPWGSGFAQLTRMFNEVWYGERPTTHLTYEQWLPAYHALVLQIPSLHPEKPNE